MVRQIFRERKIVFSVIAGLIICGLFFSISPIIGQTNNTSQTDAVKQNTPEVEDTKIIEAEPVFVPTDAGNDFVDSVYSTIYGTNSYSPPNGMGSDDTTYTTITESMEGIDTLRYQENFPSKPSYWLDDGMSYNGDFNADGDSSSGYLICPYTNTNSYSKIKFSVNLACGSSNMNAWIHVRIYFYDSSGNWDLIDTIDSSSFLQKTYSSTDSQYLHMLFRVRIAYTADCDPYNEFSFYYLRGDSWKISGYEANWGAMYQVVYRFSDVDYDSYAKEQLWIDFADSSPSNEDLDFWVECGDSSPDNLLVNNYHSDFYADIDVYLTESTFYVEIRDDYRLEDNDLDSWHIEKMYIKLTNSAPKNYVPTCSNLDDTDNLYAGYKYYQVTTSHTDADGYGDFSYIYLYLYDNNRDDSRWRLRYHEDTNEFSDFGDSYDYLTFDADGSSYSKTSTSLKITFTFMINWNHPSLDDIDLRVSSYDGAGVSDTDYYEVNWDICRNLELSNFDLDDGFGTGDRGDPGGNILSSGIITYKGSTLHPPSDQIDVYVTCSSIDTSPWEATDFSGVDGSFSVNVDAGLFVGSQTYTCIVVEEGNGASSYNLLWYLDDNSHSYITDRVVLQQIDAIDNRVNVDESVDVSFWLQYEYDNTNVTNGFVSLDGISASHQEHGIWLISDSKNTVTCHTYDTVICSGNIHGVTTVNNNSLSCSVIWDRVMIVYCSIDDTRVNVGTTVTVRIEMFFEYNYEHITHGTVLFNGYAASHDHGRFWETTVTRNEVCAIVFDEVTVSGINYGITAVNQNGISRTVIWDRIIVYDQFSDEPDNRANYNTFIEFYHVLKYEYDNSSVTTGTVTAMISNHEMLYVLHQGDGLYYFQLNCVNPATRTIHTITHTGGDYGITLVNQNNKTLTAIYDGIEIYDFGSDSYPLVNGEFSIWLKARSVIDGHPLGAEDTIVIDDETATWNGTHFIISRIFTDPGDKLFFVNSSIESTYSITRRYINPSLVVHVSTVPTITGVTSEFYATDSLYQGILSNDSLWIQWDPANDPIPPSFDFIISGNYITSWNITSSWSLTTVDSGNSAGSYNYQIEISLDYTLNNHTYTIGVTTQGGYTSEYIVYVTVRDYTVPEISSPTDSGYEFGSTDNVIVWTLNDVHPNLYDVVGNGTDDTLSFDYSWSNGDLSYDIDGLSPGTYSFILVVIDDYSNQNSDTVIITVVDTTSPTWVDEPTDTTIEYGNTYSFDANATDLSDITSYWISDTDYFAVDSEGFITDLGNLEVGSYPLELQCYDEHGNMLSTTFTVTISDTIIPVWINEPVNEVLDYGEIYSFDSEAADLSGISSYWINDTSLFTITSNGLIESKSALEVGTYGLEIRAYDPYSHYCSSIITIEVVDTTPPTWTIEPSSFTVELNNTLFETYGATDLSGIDTWWVNDTSNFQISSQADLENASYLVIGVYYLEISVNDTYGNTLTKSIAISVVDTRAPTWIEEPYSFSHEYGIPLSMEYTAVDSSGIDNYWLNDTDNFQMVDGTLSNVTLLVIGSYDIQIYVNDTVGNEMSTSITITISEGVGPSWVVAPTDQVVEFGQDLSAIFEAHDVDGIAGWSTNNSDLFSITDGHLINENTLDVGVYWITIEVIDIYNHATSETIKVTCEDTTLPVWIEEPIDQVVELGSNFLYDLNASDLSGIDSYVINDTIKFHIDASGVVSNITSLTVGTYHLHIIVYDVYGNHDDGIFDVMVIDTTCPEWITEPVNQVLELGTEYSFECEAYDIDCIESYWINDTTNFLVDGAGHLVSNSVLDIGVYGLEVRAYDPSDNYCTISISIEVVDTVAPNWVINPTDQTIELGDSLYYDIDATDLSSIDCWTVDNAALTIDQDGILENSSVLALGSYDVTISVNDTYGNTRSTMVSINVVDTTPPEITSPEDFTISVDNTESNITWIVSDLSSGIYEILRNGSSIASGTWSPDDSSITCFIDNPEVGLWEYEISITDESGNSASDSVVVTVEDSETTSTSTNTGTTGTTIIPPGGNLTIIIVIIGAGSGLIVVIVIILRRRV